jgi:SAM-dependent methyltransferase
MWVGRSPLRAARESDLSEIVDRGPLPTTSGKMTSGEWVLDVGCGTGTAAKRRVGQTGKVIGIDASPEIDDGKFISRRRPRGSLHDDAPGSLGRAGGEGTVDRVQRFGDAAGGRARPASRDADGVAGARLLIAASKSELDATAVVTLYPKP